MKVLALAATISLAMGFECVRDSQGNQICVSTQPDNNVCGSTRFPGGRGFSIRCNDIVVRKVAADGKDIFTRVLAGESQEDLRRFLVDARDRVIVFGTTFSRQFPTTADAVQRTYAGPQPQTYYGSLLPVGGDLFLSILGPSGDLTYSTYLGSSGNDTILGVSAASDTQVNVLAGAGGGNFPIVPAGSPALSSGPVLFRFDLERQTMVRSSYLPIAAPGSAAAYVTTVHDDGTVAVAITTGLYTFGSDGQQRAFVSLESFAFSGLPLVSSSPTGDVWLVGVNTSQQTLVARLIAGTVEAFRWTLPVVDDGHSYLGPHLGSPFFGPDGLTYLTGGTVFLPGSETGRLKWTTLNALLVSPCSPNFAGILAVLSPSGETKMLSYRSDPFRSFAANPDGSVDMVKYDAKRIPIDLSERPKATCAADVLDRLSTPWLTVGVGQVVRLRGGSFGPEAPVTLTAGADGRFPTSLNGLSVEVAGIAAPLLSAAPGEVVFAIPFSTPDGDAIPVTVRDRGQQSAPLSISVRAAAPWLVEPILNADGTPNHFTTPASWGSTATLFVTGAGPYSPPLEDGLVAPAGASRRLQLPVSVSYQTTGPTPEPATMLYAGPAPDFVGLAQINIQLPPRRPLSSITPLLTIGSVSRYLPSIWLK